MHLKHGIFIVFELFFFLWWLDIFFLNPKGRLLKFFFSHIHPNRALNNLR